MPETVELHPEVDAFIKKTMRDHEEIYENCDCGAEDGSYYCWYRTTEAQKNVSRLKFLARAIQTEYGSIEL